jgi:tetratricopeptide (TPR) repeat protein/tRNA A-37 threonylcarbamoyl transferase component Bud32
MDAALSRPTSNGLDATSPFDPAVPGVLATIAQTIGPVPRVLLRDTTPDETPGPIVRPDGNHADSSVRYRIDGEIARGGMGAVLKGRDPDLGREVALKVLRDDFRNDANMVRRFVEEAQIGGQLQHPGIVPIYELGTFADRRPFFSMKLVKGKTLAELLEARSEPTVELPRLLSIFEAICQTVAYAHARGVIHRDLKPSNVMVGSFGEVQVMDWGLAKVLQRGGVVDDASAGKMRDETVIATARSGGHDDADLSHAGSVMGTPAYMAPEQARGEIDQINERADVFALGSILTEILTDRPAFTGRSVGEIQRKAALGDTDDALNRLDACGADADLITMAKDCLAREQDDRPRDASVVAERITAYVGNVQERMRKAELTGVEERARRRLTTVVAASLLATSIVGGLGFTYWQHQRQEAAARISLALKEATLLHNQTVDHPDDPARWPAALEGLKRAENALAGGGDSDTRQQLVLLATQVQTGAKAAERDRVLMAKLVDIRSAKADDPSGSATDAAYADAFREAGIDVEALGTAAAAARIAARPEPVRHAIVAALDHWTAVRKGRGAQGEAWPKLVAVARAADPDPDRDALRSALAVEDKSQRLKQVRPLADRAKAEAWSPASLVLLASTLANSGDFDNGVRVLRRASGVHPTDVWVHYALGSLLENTMPPLTEEAIEAYAAARALRPETGHELAHMLEKLRRLDEAEGIFRDLVARRPEMVRHLACLGVYLNERGRADEAGPFLERAVAAGRKAVEHDPKSAVDHFSLGNALQCHGKLDEAITSYRKAISLDPTSVTAFNNLGSALRKAGQIDEAIASDRKAIELAPNDAGIRVDLGNALSKKGQIDEAIASYRKAIELSPRFAGAHIDLGTALNAKGRIDEAIAEFRNAIELDPKSADTHDRLGATLCDGKHDYAGAIVCFRKAIELDPTFARAFANLGNALRYTGQTDEAIANSRKAIMLDPKSAGAHYNLGASLCNLKRDYDGAIVCFRRAIELDPKLAVFHLSMGIALHHKGRIDEAIASYRRAIELDPKFAGAQENLADALNDWGRVDEAIVEYRKAIKLNPKHAESHARLGFALRKKGRIDEAIAECRTAVELNPKHARARTLLARLERAAAYQDKFPDFLKGDFAPTTNDQRLGLAEWCRIQKRNHTGARLFTDAFASDPKLADDQTAGHRYNAACFASLAAAGQGEDAATLDETERTRLRKQALDWLRAELALCAKRLDDGQPVDRAGVPQKMRHWQQDADLAGIRDAAALAKLPDAERKQWQALWNDVHELLERAQGKTP